MRCEPRCTAPLAFGSLRQAFTSNDIKTSKYTVLNFLPKNLFEQFRRLSNLWFLCIAGLQMVPQSTLSGGVPVIFIPLGIVVAATALREAFEDIVRPPLGVLPPDLRSAATRRIMRSTTAWCSFWMLEACTL